MKTDITELESVASQIRGKLVEMSHYSRAAHLGSALSCVDILVTLYWNSLAIAPDNPAAPDRDRFILSKGHAAAALFATLAMKGFFPETLLDTFGQAGGLLEEHPGPGCAPGVEAATGSLGHGLPLGIGMALASRIQSIPYRVCVLMSDGECNEGSVWEGAMFAAGKRLHNLLAIIDFNKWQATGRSCEVMALEPLEQKWRSFGWEAYEINGHDIKVLLEIMNRFPSVSGKPVAIIAHTIKGKGVSFMEDDNNWHYRIPNAQEVVKAKGELGLL
ncbi:transketolase [Desulfococcaceae bacterium HSG9]|nr:transketolase [Desulfococcaceae bacterium HSG9]